ncbi:MAG: hypothetical protein CR986_08125 [Ignavibacteriae bacterium]|nr:MAG: hypothetical protein CR986_08125 [Ignavibacteriota bacterium]
MKSFETIIGQEEFRLENILNNSEKYFAHRRDEPLKYETLAEHLQLTLKYFLKLVMNNKLEEIIDYQICDLVESQGFGKDKILAEFIKEQFVTAIYFHDFGKVNENFQIKK